MLGVILYLYFLAVGFLYADMLYKEKDIYFRGWMGGVFGNVLLMAGITVPSFIFGFSYISHAILIVLSIAPYFIIKYRKKEALFKDLFRVSGEGYLDIKTFLAVIAPITLIICILMTNHILAPYGGGAVASGQCTYGDLQMHLGFITSIAEQGEFPPEYAFLSGTVLNYPFFIDMLSSSLYLFGAPLRLAVLLPSYVISLLLVTGFYILAFSLTKRRSAAVLATVFFFFCGGFGFAYFFEGAKADHSVFTRIFTEFYETPTNLNDMNIRWANSICDMIIPQRTTMAGWFTVIPALWMLTDAVKTRSRTQYIVLGVFAGCMPMIHTHSFLALGIISAVMLVLYLPVSKGGSKKKHDNTEMKNYLINWALFGGITLVMAMPQLLLWTFRQTSGNESFLNFQFNWVNHNDPYLWFYLKNWGITALFAVPAVLSASKDNKKLLAGCAVIFILAELIKFQPNEYDNNKLFFIAYMILLIAVSGWLLKMWDALKGVKGRAYLAVIVILAGTVSGALTIGREYNSGAEYQTFSAEDIAFADFIRENTDPNAAFLTTTDHLNPIVTLAGRSIYLGSSLYVYFHGMGNEMSEREETARRIYSASSADEIRSLAEEIGMDYIVVGNRERSEFEVNDAAFTGFEKVYDQDGYALYKV